MLIKYLLLGIYLTNSAEACHYITEHTEAELICVDGNSQLEKYSTKNFANLKAIVIWNEDPNSNLVGKFNVPIYRWNEFLILGAKLFSIFYYFI